MMKHRCSPMKKKNHSLKQKKHSYNTFQNRKRVNGSINFHRKPKKRMVSHAQIMRLILAIEPNYERQQKFIKQFNNNKIEKVNSSAFSKSCPFNSDFVDLHNCGETTICKTPLWVIKNALHNSGPYKINFVTKEYFSVATTDAYLIVGKTNNRDYSFDLTEYNKHQPVVEHIRCYNKEKYIDASETAIICIPGAGIFYSIFGTNHHNQSKLNPLPMAWLRLCTNSGNLAKGSYLSSISTIYKISPTYPEFQLCKKIVFKSFHFPDKEIFIIPDHWTTKLGKDDDAINATWLKDKRKERIKWNELLINSTTNRALCKQTVRCCI